MPNSHEPRAEFVERLEWRISSEARLRNRSIEARAWTPGSRAGVFVALVALVAVSMGIGGAAVAAAFQAKSNERRDLLATGFAQRVDLARQRVALAREAMQAAEQRVEVGLGLKTAVAEASAKVAEAEAQLASLELQLQEVRLTGQEPLDEIAAPLVSGRDFVGQRLQVELAAPRAALELEQLRLRDLRVRVEIGTVNPVELDVARSRVAEVEAAVEGLGRKIEIRRRFLRGEIARVEAELRVLESVAETQHRSLLPKVELAKRRVEDINAKVNVGLAQRVDLAEVTLQLRSLETDLAKAALDLALIRRRLQQPGETR